MRLAPNSLCYKIRHVFGYQYGETAFCAMFAETLSYLTGFITAYEYQHQIKPYCAGRKLSSRDFRMSLVEDSYLCMNLKLFTFRSSTRNAQNLTRQMSVSVRDSVMVNMVLANCPALRRFLASRLQEIPAELKPMLDIKTALSYFSSNIYKPVLKYVKHKTWHKLRFVANSTNCELGDLENEIMTKVVRAYYSLLPLHTCELHIINYLKRSGHNCAMNIIESATSQKGGRLVDTGFDSNNQRQCSLLVLSENQMQLSAEGELSNYEDLAVDNSSVEHELSMSVQQVLTKYQQRTKKYRYLCLLMGQPDPEFTQFLRTRKALKSDEDNTDYQLRVSVQQFNTMLSAFLHIREEHLNVFLLRVARKDLALQLRRV